MKKLFGFCLVFTFITISGFSQQKNNETKLKKFPTPPVSILERTKAKEARETAVKASAPVSGKTVIIATPASERIVPVESTEATKKATANN